MKCFCTPRIALMNALTFYTRGLEMACKEMVCWHGCKCRMKSCTLKNDQTCMFFMFLCCFSLRREQKLRLAGREIELRVAFKSCCSGTEDGRVSQGRMAFSESQKVPQTLATLIMACCSTWFEVVDDCRHAVSWMQRKTQTFWMRTQRLWTIRTESPVYKSIRSTTNSTEITATETDGQNIRNILIRVFQPFLNAPRCAWIRRIWKLGFVAPKRPSCWA